MLEHIYPAFKRGRVMKRELLLALRDYTYSGLSIQYETHVDGIIKGCRVNAKEDVIAIAPGLIKCGGLLFVIGQEQHVSYAHTATFVSLKFKINMTEDFEDYIRYETIFYLDEELGLKENELEVCRFKLREGSLLRDSYIGFHDIQTEYDTLNLAQASWSGVEALTLAVDITKLYARELLAVKEVEPLDLQFAYLCMSNEEGVKRELICDYLERKNPGCEAHKADNAKLYEQLCQTLEEVKSKKSYRNHSSFQGADMIIVD